MKVQKWHSPHKQMCRIGRSLWSVARLFELSRGLPVMKIPIDHLYIYYTYDSLTLTEMVSHMKAINDADLKKPIILDQNGEIMDGRHRVMKAIMLGKKTIRAVRFEENPNPCEVEKD